eukprot:247160_1
MSSGCLCFNCKIQKPHFETKVQKLMTILGIILFLISIIEMIGTLAYALTWTDATHTGGCCGIIKQKSDFSDWDNMVCKEEDMTKSKFDFHIDNSSNILCEINGIVCDKYNYGSNTLSECVNTGGWKLSDLCQKDIIAQEIDETETVVIFCIISFIFIFCGSTCSLCGIIRCFDENKCCQNSCFQLLLSAIYVFVWIIVLIFVIIFVENQANGYGTTVFDQEKQEQIENYVWKDCLQGQGDEILFINFDVNPPKWLKSSMYAAFAYTALVLGIIGFITNVLIHCCGCCKDAEEIVHKVSHNIAGENDNHKNEQKSQPQSQPQNETNNIEMEPQVN